MIFLSASLKCELLPGKDDVFFSGSPLPLAKCLAYDRCSVNVYELNTEEPECSHRRLSRLQRVGKALESRSPEDRVVCVVCWETGGQNNRPPKDVPALIPRTLESVTLCGKGDLQLQVGFR